MLTNGMTSQVLKTVYWLCNQNQMKLKSAQKERIFLFLLVNNFLRNCFSASRNLNN